ncbi:MAG: sulfotransferase domain-containing protein [Candidatus Thorarchaeota archaeon]|jgi:hypothetical protein
MLKSSIEVQTQPLFPRIFINAFPKSGTHLGVLLTATMVKPQRNLTIKDDKSDWLSTFRFNAFSDVWIPDAPVKRKILEQIPGTYLKGHCGYKPEYQQWFEQAGTCMIFVYRDLRDVAVSMSYHVEVEDTNLVHSEKEAYRPRPTREDKLLAIINGIAHDPGLIKRWELYAPWLEVPWVLKLKYEDILSNKRRAIEMAVQYVIVRTSKHKGISPMILQDNYDQMVNGALHYMSRPVKYSPTFRKGVSGQWRHEFTPRVVEAFVNNGGDEWIRRLRYKEV